MMLKQSTRQICSILILLLCTSAYSQANNKEHKVQMQLGAYNLNVYLTNKTNAALSCKLQNAENLKLLTRVIKKTSALVLTAQTKEYGYPSGKLLCKNLKNSDSYLILLGHDASNSNKCSSQSSNVTIDSKSRVVIKMETVNCIVEIEDN